MADPFIGQTMIFAGNFAPRGWSFCNGQLIPISQNDALYDLIGTTYGGDGQQTFALPNLQGRLPIHRGTNASINYQLGQTGGEETHTLTIDELASHNHQIHVFATQGDKTTLKNNYLAQPNQDVSIYTNAAPDSSLAPQTLYPFGNSQPHENMQPFLVMNFCICMEGLFPVQP